MILNNKEYYRVELDLNSGSAYEYRHTSEIPTIIKYGRTYDGKFQKGIIRGIFNNIALHNIIYLIKRGMSEEEINEYIKDKINKL